MNGLNVDLFIMYTYCTFICIYEHICIHICTLVPINMKSATYEYVNHLAIVALLCCCLVIMAAAETFQFIIGEKNVFTHCSWICSFLGGGGRGVSIPFFYLNR